ncbi:MAG: phenylalanine--tRNA ligase subunit alpha [Candidatus Micrarchaeota archaeon]|nr:phenylalanine--tRNA ligase subunit alpha [Candidatus Micrarchaeota archaeon]
MLHQIESKMLSALSGRMSSEELSQKAGIPLSSVLSFSQSLKEKGHVSIEQTEERKLSLTPEGQGYAAKGLPEQSVHRAAQSGAFVSSLSQLERSVGLPWASRNGWVKIEGGRLTSLCSPEPYFLQEALSRISRHEEVDDATVSTLLKRRLVSQAAVKKTYIEPTALQPERASGTEAIGSAEGGKASASGAAGAAALAGAAAAPLEVNSLTRDMLLSGSWRGALFRSYDVSAPAEVPSPAKRHAISRLRHRISRIFTEMGFEEMEGPEAQSAFWNFDALFQPQDHPARELADTFYLKQGIPLPDDAGLVSRIKKAHEKCWGGAWSGEVAEKGVLRTHTTAVSASYLYNECRSREPKKYFSIGKVYRNEATDYKHLAEFFQVEGIVVWEGATFRDLLGLLREFYRKLGFDKIRFQPSYFPYTEPSLEISVFFEKKSQWLELGGAGIFRPEVSIPLCDRYPVLAWGLSLERPLMLLNDMDDIRDFYRGNAGWLRKQKVQ